MPRDVQILGGIGSAPQSYTVPNATEIIPRSINATFNGAGTATAWVPVVEIISDAGVVVARCPCLTTVIAGGSAECSFYPSSDEAASSSSDFASVVASVGTANTLRGWWRLGEAAAPFLDSSGWTGGPTDLTIAGAGAAPTTHVVGALGGGQDDGAILLNGNPATGQYLHNASGAVNTGINTSWSVMAWVKPSSDAATWIAAVYNNVLPVLGVAHGWALTLNWSAGTVQARTRRVIAGVVANAAATITADTWTFLVGTYDGATLKLYVNGALAASTADARADTFDPYSNVDLGVTFDDPFPPVGTVKGVLDEVAVWGSVLTLTEVQELYLASF